MKIGKTRGCYCSHWAPHDGRGNSLKHVEPVNKRQDNKLENCCIWLVIYLNCTMMHGLRNLKFFPDVSKQPNGILFKGSSAFRPCRWDHLVVSKRWETNTLWRNVKEPKNWCFMLLKPMDHCFEGHSLGTRLYSVKNTLCSQTYGPTNANNLYKSKAIPLQAWTGPEGFRRLRLPEFLESRQMKVVKLSAKRNGCIYPAGDTAGTHFCWRPSLPQGHSAAGGIMPLKYSNDTIGNRTRDLPTCNAVPATNCATAKRHTIYIISQIVHMRQLSHLLWG